MWKEEIVVSFEIISRQLPEGLSKNAKTLRIAVFEPKVAAGLNLGPEFGYPVWVLLWFSPVSLDKCQNSTSRYHTTASFHIFSNSLFMNLHIQLFKKFPVLYRCRKVCYLAHKNSPEPAESTTHSHNSPFLRSNLILSSHPEMISYLQKLLISSFLNILQIRV